LKKLYKIKLETKIMHEWSECKFLLFEGEKYVKSLNKIRPQSPKEKLSKYLWSTSFCTW